MTKNWICQIESKDTELYGWFKKEQSQETELHDWIPLNQNANIDRVQYTEDFI
jgi:hypothetical protein